jgi:DNA-nicking Smr family endonuclease
VSDDDDLFRRALHDVVPLKKRAAPRAVRKKPTPTPAPPAAKEKPAAAPSPPKKPELPELTAGAAIGVDLRTVRKLRRGKLMVDARLDLHGHTQDAAYEALAGFLARAQQSGSRTVLVITGKSGVLRQMAPRWLNAAPNRARVLSFTAARPADGGDGALYVLLKKAKRA